MAINAYSNNYYQFLYSGVNSPYRNNSLSNSALSLLNSLNTNTSSTKNLSALNSLLSNNGYKVNQTSATEGTKNYLSTIKSGSLAMKNSLSGLMSTAKSSAFSQLTAVSSDTQKLKVDASGAKAGVAVNANVNIDQLASGQVNEGTALTANKNAAGPALYEFSIESGGKSHQFSISTSAGDTNKNLQQKIADAINKKNIGVTASVAEDTKNNTSVLTIQSKETGADEKNTFSIQDTYGDAIALTGTGTASRQAQDALYRIDNGEQKTSKSNTIDLGNGIKATLLEASGDTVNVSMKADGSKAAGLVDDLVKGYNDIIAAVKSNDTEKSLQLNYQLSLLSKTYSASLSRIGVSMGTNGRLEVNKDKLNSAAESGELERFFTQDRGASYGFANRLAKLSGEIQSNPMKYTDISSLGLSDFNNGLYSGFQSSRYSQAYNTGLFLNMFV